jgi:hypothetical protein
VQVATVEPSTTAETAVEPTPVSLPDGECDSARHGAAAASGLRCAGGRLHLEGKDFAKAERCLANAIYFKSRSEPVRGQMAGSRRLC